MNTIPHVFDSVQKPWILNNKPWLIVGKGPSFLNIYKLPLEEYYVFGLNHVCETIKCTIGACIDIEVLSESFLANVENVLLPWHVHRNYRSISAPLPYELPRNKILNDAHISHKLLYVNISTWKGEHPLNQPVLTVRYNSGEIPFQLLGRLGVKKIYSVGIDGGKEYSLAFKHLKPLTNGQSHFDNSIKMIEKTCKQYDIKWIKV